MNKLHRHFVLDYAFGAPGSRAGWNVEDDKAARKLARTLRQRQGVQAVTFGPVCTCATPDALPPQEQVA
jgi:hypothetical protein